ncbi:response regulator [Clostridium manihotivorum]|nr:response regulator [Clostridium manihotivorum]
MKKLLIVDDDNNIRLLIKQTLEELEDIDIYEAGDAETALEFIEKVPVDLILLDISLPNMDGYELLRRLGSMECQKQTKTFIITAKAQEKEVNIGIELGADMYITKPFDPEYLLIKTCEYLGISIE